ncbi:MAG: hypothetical protein QUV05_06230 [Phycisphaerae bacterium]|nr:hypothetical protein [Phycisphaerae bacterium]
MTDTTPERLVTAPKDNQPPASAHAQSLTTDTRPGPAARWWCRHPRPPYACPTGARRVFIPVYGWLDVDDTHRARVEHYFHAPMLILALLVLPILLIEWSYGERFNAAHPVARMAICVTGAIIWLAFLVEFIIKIMIAESRWKYAIRNWLDIVVVALPLLRPLRALRVVRAAQVARVSRAFTLRGVIMKLLQTAAATALGLGFVRRIVERFRTPQAADQIPNYEQWSQACLIAEIKRLNARIRELEQALGDFAASERTKPDETKR